MLAAPNSVTAVSSSERGELLIRMRRSPIRSMRTLPALGVLRASAMVGPPSDHRPADDGASEAGVRFFLRRLVAKGQELARRDLSPFEHGPRFAHRDGVAAVRARHP